MSAPTHMDTYLHIIGSCAMQYGWYRDIAESNTPDDDPLFDHPDMWVGWSVSWTDDDSGDSHTVDHAAIMSAMRKIMATDRPEFLTGTAVQACRDFMRDRDDADFDADTADQVIQVCAFGKVIYG